MKKVEVFNSIGEFMDKINSRPENEYYKGHSLSSKEGSEKFTGTKDYEEAEKLFAGGWKAGKKYLSNMTEGKKAFAPTPRYIRQRTVAGGRINMSALIAGSDRVFMRRKKMLKDSMNPVINVYYAITAPSFVKKSDLAIYAGRLFSAVRNLENEGYKIELYMGFTAQDGNDQVASLIKVKSSNEALSELKMLYPVVHPSFMRRHNFRWLETTPIINKHYFGYGYFVDQKELKELANKSGKKIQAAISVYHAIQNNFSVSDFEESIKKQRAEVVKI